VVKRISSIVLVVMFFAMSSLNAFNPYQSLCNRIVNLGEKIDSVDSVPLIGKLTNLLPLAALAAVMQKCPGQAMMILAGLTAYSLMYNEFLCALFQGDGIMGIDPENNQEIMEFDEELFVFDEEEAKEVLTQPASIKFI